MFPFPETTDVDEARRQIRIMERAKALFGNGDYYYYYCGDGTYGVAKRSYSDKRDTAYTVTLKPSCDCPDFEAHQDYCKHCVALWLALEEEAEGEQVARYEAIMATCEDEKWGTDPYAEY